MLDTLCNIAIVASGSALSIALIIAAFKSADMPVTRRMNFKRVIIRARDCAYQAPNKIGEN